MEVALIASMRFLSMNSIDVDSDIFSTYMHSILSALLEGGWRNIYILIIHQTVGCNLTEIACMNAAKKLVFSYAEKKKGRGWWGEKADDGIDSPWNWFHVMSVMPHLPNVPMPLDHAGFHETSLLWHLCPSAVAADRIKDNSEWFCQCAQNATLEHGAALTNMILDYWKNTIK